MNLLKADQMRRHMRRELSSAFFAGSLEVSRSILMRSCSVYILDAAEVRCSNDEVGALFY